MPKSSRKCVRSSAALAIVLVTSPILSWKSSDLSMRNTNRITLTPAKLESMLMESEICSALLSSWRKSASGLLFTRNSLAPPAPTVAAATWASAEAEVVSTEEVPFLRTSAA
eukprot:766112-Hanusia_phi.AAC.2